MPLCIRILFIVISAGMAQKPLEEMSCSDVVQWLSSVAGLKFNQDIFDAIEGILYKLANLISGWRLFI